MFDGGAGKQKVATNRRQSRAVEAAGVLELLASAHHPGARLGTKKQVREHCKVSVGTFNEALKLAEARGFITLRPGPGGGLFAREPSPMVRLGNSMLALDVEENVVQEAMRLRDALDPLIVEDAIAHRTFADLDRMQQGLDDMLSSLQDGDPLGFIRANWQLHRVIAAPSQGPLLKTLYLHLLDLLETHTLNVYPVEDGESLSRFLTGRYQLHVEIVESITDRDRTRAAMLMARHTTEAVGGDRLGRAAQPAQGDFGERPAVPLTDY